MNKIFRNGLLMLAVGAFVASCADYNELDGYKADPDAEILAGLPSVDAGTLRAYYDRNVLPAPVVWIIVGDRKTLPMNEIARFGTIVELEKKDIYK